MLNIELFLEVLPYLFQGMLGIFLVTVVMILCVCLLNKLTSGKKPDEQ